MIGTNLPHRAVPLPRMQGAGLSVEQSLLWHWIPLHVLDVMQGT